MTLNEYQRLAHSTCKESCDNPDYPTHEILEEAVEHYEKFYYDLPEKLRDGFRDIFVAASYLGKLAKDRAKAVRRNIATDVIYYAGNDDQKREKGLELGDCLWGIAEAARQYGFSLEEIAQMNIDKLSSRQLRDKIEGDGDHR